MNIETISDFRAAIRHGKYDADCGYPVYFITADGAALSFDAAKEEKRCIIEAIADDDRSSGWRVVAADINWEDSDLICDHTYEKIESAYSD